MSSINDKIVNTEPPCQSLIIFLSFNQGDEQPRRDNHEISNEHPKEPVSIAALVPLKTPDGPETVRSSKYPSNPSQYGSCLQEHVPTTYDLIVLEASRSYILVFITVQKVANPRSFGKPIQVAVHDKQKEFC